MMRDKFEHIFKIYCLFFVIFMILFVTQTIWVDARIFAMVMAGYAILAYFHYFGLKKKK